MESDGSRPAIVIPKREFWLVKRATQDVSGIFVRRAARQVWSNTREQRCWVHKTANVLDKLPKRFQPGAKHKLHEIWIADTRQHANEAFDLFVKTSEANTLRPSSAW